MSDMEDNNQLVERNDAIDKLEALRICEEHILLSKEILIAQNEHKLRSKALKAKLTPLIDKRDALLNKIHEFMDSHTLPQFSHMDGNYCAEEKPVKIKYNEKDLLNDLLPIMEKEKAETLAKNAYSVKSIEKHPYIKFTLKKEKASK